MCSIRLDSRRFHISLLIQCNRMYCNRFMIYFYIYIYTHIYKYRCDNKEDGDDGDGGLLWLEVSCGS